MRKHRSEIVAQVFLPKVLAYRALTKLAQRIFKSMAMEETSWKRIKTSTKMRTIKCNIILCNKNISTWHNNIEAKTCVKIARKININ